MNKVRKYQRQQKKKKRGGKKISPKYSTGSENFSGESIFSAAAWGGTFLRASFGITQDGYFRFMEAADIKGALGVLHMYISLQKLCKVGGIISILQWKISTKKLVICPGPDR